MSSLSPTHRVGMTEAEILSILELLQEAKATIGISTECSSAYVKLSTVYHKISLGAKIPDYVPNGRKRESAVNMDSLGATSKEKEFAHMSEDEQFAELDRLNAAMLAELVSEGSAGSENIISQERRAAERVEQDNMRDEHSTDNDTIHTALMSSIAGTVSEQDL